MGRKNRNSRANRRNSNLLEVHGKDMVKENFEPFIHDHEEMVANASGRGQEIFNKGEKDANQSESIFR
jgi:hypothetical protein